MAPPLPHKPLNSSQTWFRPLSEVVWTAAHPRGHRLPVQLPPHATRRPIASMQKEQQPSISLSCDSRGQCTLINVFHYYAYVFIFLMMDSGKKTPCIFCDTAVRHHQAIKHNTSHAYLYSTPNNISKYCLSRLITKSACGVQTGRGETR